MNNLTQTPVELPWWRSKIIVGAIVSILSKLLVASGLIGDLAPEDTEELTNLIVLVVGGIGDLVAIGSRVRQKAAPKITASAPPSGVLPMLAAALLLPLLMAGCTPATGLSTAPPPAAIADRTLLDEKVGVLATNGYTAAATAAAIAIRVGAINDPERIRQIGELDRRAYAAVVALRGAYLAGNAQSYAEAIAQANEAVEDFLSAVNP